MKLHFIEDCGRHIETGLSYAEIIFSICYNNVMDIVTFWETYGSTTSPADFVWQYGKGDIDTAVKKYLRQKPSFYGIMQRGTWRTTFESENQYNRECVSFGLMAYLEQTEETWRPLVEEARQAEIQAKIKAKEEAEAEALALAVARVEAEARSKNQGLEEDQKRSETSVGNETVCDAAANERHSDPSDPLVQNTLLSAPDAVNCSTATESTARSDENFNPETDQ
ncbi:MAG: hypothetical protein ACOYI9_00320 [Candidatus Hydrogenedentales bacterium]